jgi:hypothetical protein
MLHSHSFHRLSQPVGFLPVDRQRYSGGNRTEFAVACTDIAEDHKGRSAMIPAFANVGTIPAGTDCMQVLPHYQVFNAGIVLTIRTLHFHPVRKAGADCNTVFQVNNFCKYNERECMINL